MCGHLQPKRPLLPALACELHAYLAESFGEEVVPVASPAHPAIPEGAARTRDVDEEDRARDPANALGGLEPVLEEEADGEERISSLRHVGRRREARLEDHSGRRRAERQLDGDRGSERLPEVDDLSCSSRSEPSRTRLRVEVEALLRGRSLAPAEAAVIEDEDGRPQ